MIDHLYAQASACLARGDVRAAIDHMIAATVAAPKNADAQNNLGILYEQCGQNILARACYEKALALNPRHAEAHNNLGDLLRACSELAESVRHLRDALRLKPGYVQAWNNLAIALQAQGDLGDSEAALRQAIALKPDYVRALNNLGALLHKQDRYEEAAEELQRGMALRPDYPELLNNLGLACIKLGRLEQAEQALQRAIGLKAEFAEAYNNLGYLYQERAAPDTALKFHDRALALKPGLVEAHWQRAFAYLFLGDFAQGWRDYEYGLDVGERARRPYPFPPWQDEPLQDKTLLIYGEQGIGDEIMFASCVPDVLAAGARIILACDPRLAPLYARSFPGVTVRGARPTESTQWTAGLGHIDFQIPVGSLPLHFRHDIGQFPGNPYLTVNTAVREKWRKRYDALGEGLTIGISWRGGKRVDPLKRSTTLAQWAPLLRTAACHFVNLQYGDCSKELAEAKDEFGLTIHHWPDSDPMTNLDDFAAQVAALDLVISVSNATVHVAGAVGVECWALLPHVPSWRWMLRRLDTPWYRSLTLMRQPAPGAWQPVFDDIRMRLQERLRVHTSSR